ncbi:dipeptide epimerase [Allorhodopirellula solitaria]|uniref:Dipeptide epimerase n=1 Tax=Allorhodopirellula solitaria TaxID=2527987 RepID=A0A5C5X8Y5_9BACT|nr:dipeptide epimerase [Allorhodopirellula solitaria]TWT59298.1 L-Ala-D/L-Glu epimerase [Allorhodopirellula solitaria]
MQLAYRVFDLPLKHVFRISRGATSVQPTFIVQLSHDDQHGYGEATTNRYYNATAAAMAAALESVRHLVESADPLQPDALLDRVSSALGGDNQFALAALDLALHDLHGKLKGEPLHRLWGWELADVPASNYTIGIDTIESMVAKLNQMPGWPVYKIKLGTPDDLAIVRELREHTSAAFRVDANCGWTVEQTIRYAPQMAELGVEFIEQPLPAADRDGAAEVRHGSALPIIADESCVVEDDVQHCIGRFDGINIKLTKCGGMAPARRMIDHAKSAGMKVMMGCMTESSVGISAIAQFLPALDYVDMDGAALIATDIADGAKVIQGRCQFPSGNGTGVSLHDGPLATDCRQIESTVDEIETQT